MVRPMYTALVLFALLEATHSFSPVSTFLPRAGPALRPPANAQHRLAGRPAASPLCAMKLDGLLLAQAAPASTAAAAAPAQAAAQAATAVAPQAAAAPAAAAPAQAAAQAATSAAQAAATAAQTAAQPAQAAGSAVQATVEGVVPKVAQDPSILQTIIGGDSLVLTVMATVVLILGIVVTAATGYITYATWQDEQERNRLTDPSTDDYRQLMRDISELERDTKGKVSSKGRAMKEAQSVSDAPARPPTNTLLAEPGNRDARRAKAKRDREEQARKKRVERARAESGKTPEESGLSSFSEDNNKGFFDMFK